MAVRRNNELSSETWKFLESLVRITRDRGGQNPRPS